MRNLRYGVIMILGLILVGCSGGGGDSSTTPTSTTPTSTTPTTPTTPTSTTPTAATGVSLAVSGKSLDFSWTAGSNVDHYRISVNPDGASGFTVDASANNIASSATSFSLVIPVHKTNWLAAQYMVEACNADESTCVASPNQTLALIDSVAATVYVKASNTGASDGFGYAVSLSSDGLTLAVGANLERSAATGIDGNQADNTVIGSGAVYVFTRTGSTWAQQAYIKASNTGSNDYFGSKLSLSGDGNTLAVGAYNEGSAATGIDGNQVDNTAGSSGAVYVFTRAGSVWTQQAYVKASNTGASDGFGYAVSLSSDGNTLAVGAISEDSVATGIGGNQADNTAANAGAVYVFVRAGTTWTQQAYVKASNAGASDNFGFSVSLSSDGNTLAVGAYAEDSIATGIDGNQADNIFIDSGAVYVFSRVGAVWTQQAYVKASNTNANDRFGSSVSLSSDGNTLAVGAFFEDSAATGIDGSQADGINNAGAAYVFNRAGSTWTQQAYVKASNTGAGDQFGYAVSLSSDGNTLAVGAWIEASAATGIDGDQADNTLGNAGAAYVFSRTGTAWTQQAYVKASNTAAGESFGFAVSISGDGNTLAVGASSEDSVATGIGGNQADNTVSNSGAVYLY